MTIKTDELTFEQIREFERAVYVLAQRSGVTNDTAYSYLSRKIREQASDIIDELRANKLYNH